LTLEEYSKRNTKTQTYTIQSGDTLWQIAQDYEGITANNLLELNPTIDPYQLKIGTDIYIHKSSNDTNETYVISPGDTLWEIAKNYEGVSVKELKEANSSKRGTKAFQLSSSFFGNTLPFN
jgi:LysM repeat protein